MMAHSSTTSDDKRTRILDAAVTVFAQNGFFHSKVSDVAKEAGVADGTIYLYFKNKDDLLISVFEARMDAALEQLQQAVADAKDPPDKLCALVKRQLEMVKAQPAVAEVLTVELRQSSKFMKEYSPAAFAQLLKLIAGIVREGVETKHFETGIPPAHAARMIFGVIDELALTWLLGGDNKFDITRATDWVCEFALSALNTRSQES